MAEMEHRKPTRDIVRDSWRGSGDALWVGVSALVAALVLAPVVALAVIAAEGSGDLWPHLVANVIPVAFRVTGLLLAGVGVLVIVIGAGTAWLVTAYDFPGRRVLDWALLLPLAVPTYIIAYAYLDILHPIGPVQTTLRALLGLERPGDLWFPDIRSLTGCIILFGLVLYPYVYLSTRALFLMQAAGLVEAAETLGAGRRPVFFRIALPLARPAIALGASLALMEALNDIGASEFLGVRTLTVSIYTTWINRTNLAGAAEIALLMLAIIVALILIERWARRRQHFATTAQRSQALIPRRLVGAAGWLALLAGALPVVLGFLVPASYLLSEAIKRMRFTGIAPSILTEILNTVTISAIATVVTLALGLSVAYAGRLNRGALGTVMVRTASLGYALPGTVLAIGLLTPLAGLDNLIDGLSRAWLGVSTGLLLSGTGAALVYAYATRFLAIPVGGIEAGFAKIPYSFDRSARTLGHAATNILARIHVPLLRPALGAAALLVFVDCMKELPATLLLRPLNFETLATHLYADASRGTYEDGAVAALAIVLFGLLPVILLSRLGRPSPRAGGRALTPTGGYV
jgi:iron(III) transport system permease protein